MKYIFYIFIFFLGNLILNIYIYYINNIYTMPNLKGGDGYTFDVNRNIGGLMGRSRYSFNYAPIYNGELLQGGGDCGCGVKKTEPSLFNMLKQTGGYQKKNSKLDAIQYVSQSLSQLSAKQLTSVVQLITDYHLKKTSSEETKQLKGGNQISTIMAPLGRANLIVLAALLLLHHFAVEMPEEKKKSKEKNKKSLKKGGDKQKTINHQLIKFLQPLKNNQQKIKDLNLIRELKNAFNIKDKKNNDHINSHNGGSTVLKSIIAPLGTNAFIASGLLIILNKIVNQKKLEKHDKGIMKKGGQMEISDASMNKLIDVITPISFNVFANESFVKTLLQQKNKNSMKINRISNKNGGRGDPLRGFDVHTLGGLGAMGTNLDNISANSSGKNMLLNSKEMSVSGGSKIVKKKMSQRKSSSKKMRGGEETLGATGMPKEFYSATAKMTGYPANSGVNAKTAYGPQNPLNVGVGMLAPNTTSTSSIANPATNMKTGGASKKKDEKKKKVVKKKVMKKDDKKKDDKKKKIVKKKVMKKDDKKKDDKKKKVVKKKVMKKDDKKKDDKKKKVVKKKVMKKGDKKKTTKK